MYTRRELGRTLGLPVSLAAVAATLDARRALAAVEAIAGQPGSPEEVAADETFWREVQRAFVVDRSLINLNNGGVSPAPFVVQEAMRRYLEYSNAAPVYSMWRVLEPQRETVRQGIARLFGCDVEEVAITRNTSEGMETCQLGFDLQRGDEVLFGSQEYPRMITTFKQRQRREGIVLNEIEIPVACEDAGKIVSLYEEAITERTRLILVSHVIFLNGQVLPVREVVAMARRRGIPVLVDGAHAFAHLEFSNADLHCDYYATSLHKWLHAPHGTGFLYVRRNRIGSLWPLMAAPEEKADDVRKFEEIGTHPAANALAIGEALSFHNGIGARRKLARLLYLRDRWAERLLGHDRVRLHTSLKPGWACGIATFQIDGVAPGDIVEHLWKKQRIIVTGIKHPQFEGVRVSPSVYTTVQEVDRFCEVIEGILREGVGA